MSLIGSSAATVLRPKDRVEVLSAELAELTGQCNAIHARMVEIAAEMDRDELMGITGARSVPAWVAWKTGSSTATANAIAAVAARWAEFPLCVQGMREGWLSLDQVGVIAGRAGAGSDEHYAELARHATVSQLHKAVNLEPRPDPEPEPAWAKPTPSITKTSTDAQFTCWKITLPHAEAATFEASLTSHHDALITEWKADRANSTGAADDSAADDSADSDGVSDQSPPFPTAGQAFMRLVENSWDAEATARPQGHRSTVVVHLDVDKSAAHWHLGPLLTDAERRYLLCDTTCEVWFERDGQPIGSGRATRVISRRLRRALEHRHPTCAVPGCGATRGLHAHHIRHWEDGGPTELSNLVLVCPHHHRLHHRGLITITGPADQLTVTDSDGQPLHPGSLARPPTTPPPTVAPCPGPSGEPAQWKWYDPYQPQPPPNTN